MQAQALSPSIRIDAPARELDLLDVLFLFGALIAPMDLVFLGSFTLYDLVITGLAFLIVAGPRRLQPLPAGFLPAMFVFLLFSLVSSFRATLPVEALTQALQFAFIFFVQLPVVLTIARSPRVLRLAIVMFLLGSLATIVVAIALNRVAGADRFVSFYSDNPNRLGYPAAYLLPFVVWLLAGMWRAGHRVATLILGAVISYLMLWSLAASASRGATLAALLTLPLYLVFRHRARIDGRTMLALVVTASVIFAAGWVFYETNYFPPTLKERIQGTLSEQDSLIQDRERLAVAGGRAFESSPLVGTGLDNFRYVAKSYDESATEQAPHNMWIQFLAQVGLIGTLAFGFILARWFWMMYRAARTAVAGGRRELLWASLASMASIMLIFMTTPIMVHRHYWLLFGLGLAAAMGSDQAVRDRSMT